MRMIHFSLNPNFLIIFSRKAYSTRSLALLISSLRAMKSPLVDLWFCKQWSNSKATRILSEISRFFVKALCCSIMICGSIFFNLLANTLENILYNTLHKLIGRNSETKSRFFTFGIKWWMCDLNSQEVKMNSRKIEHKLWYSYPPNPNSVGKIREACHLDLEISEVPFGLEPFLPPLWWTQHSIICSYRRSLSFEWCPRLTQAGNYWR